MDTFLKKGLPYPHKTPGRDIPREVGQRLNTQRLTLPRTRAAGMRIISTIYHPAADSFCIIFRRVLYRSR